MNCNFGSRFQLKHYSTFNDIGVSSNIQTCNQYNYFDDERIYPDQIIPNLYLGNTFSKHPFVLGKLGISNIITANQEDINIDKTNGKVNILRLNWIDDINQSIYPKIIDAYEFIDKHLSNGEKVLVHCMAGMSRSATVVIYYMMKKFKIPFKRAYDIVKSKRPIVDINKGFEKQLRMINFN